MYDCITPDELLIVAGPTASSAGTIVGRIDQAKDGSNAIRMVCCLFDVNRFPLELTRMTMLVMAMAPLKHNQSM